MKFKIDETLPIEMANLLKSRGYDAATIHQESLQGSPDDVVAAVCREEDRILVTLDTDFSNILAYPPSHYPGIIVLRLSRTDKPYVLNIFTPVVDQLEHEDLRGQLWIVSESRIRIRL